MNKCDNCGWIGPDCDVDGDSSIQCDAGDTYPSGCCPECACHVFYYPDPIPCGFCGDTGYNLDRDGLFEKCHHCNRFWSTWKALEFIIDNPPKDHPFELAKFRLVPLPKKEVANE